jgi:hypothetical protein
MSPSVNECKKQANVAVLGTAMSAPTDAGLNPDNKH